ncbi:glutathione S-transferase family protein [Pseudoruegeria sp. HB172150]|uniref:glutathione S-transferase family protein n=1 Tax=Pseudoruegeria sp. HB172150 TaxID=2721164 RepID=UPI00155573BC|nr:glutathione S-transferase family protein [Pseudoruegeria sp. HB172150]
MLTIWGRKTSSNVQALMWGIGEMGLAHERHDVGGRYGGTETEAFCELNPNRTVPVLQDGSNAPLWETGAILRYLATRYGGGAFWPSDLLARTEVDRWAEWAKINVAQGFTVPVFWKVVRTPAAEQNPVEIQRGNDELTKYLQIAESQLGQHAFLTGEELTLADIQFGHVLFRYYDIEITRPDLPNLAAYYRQLTERPAYREHVMISYEELRA